MEDPKGEPASAVAQIPYATDHSKALARPFSDLFSTASVIPDPQKDAQKTVGGGRECARGAAGEKTKPDTCYVIEPATLSDTGDEDEFTYGAELEEELRASLLDASGRTAKTAGEGDEKAVLSAADGGCENVNELDDYEKLMRDATRLKKERDTGDVCLTGVSSVVQKHETQEDFIRSFLVTQNMHRTLCSFQTEWYEQRLKKAGMNSDAVASNEAEIPSALLANQQLKGQASSLEREIMRQRETAIKALWRFDQFKKERDFHRMHHRRLKHENDKYIQELKQLNKTLEDTLSENEGLRQKIKAGIRECTLAKMERDRLTAEVKNLRHLSQPDSSGSSPHEPPAGHMTSPPAPDVSATPSQSKNKDSAKTTGEVSALSAPKEPKKTKDSEWLTNRQIHLLLRQTHRVNESRAHAVPGQSSSGAEEPFAKTSWATRNDRVNCLSVVEAHDAAVVSLTMHSRIDLMATTSDDGTWKIWQQPGGHLVMAGSGHKDWVSSAAFHPTTSVLVTASGDGTAKLWSISEESCTHTFADHTKPLWDCCFHDTGDFFATCSMDHSIRCFDANSFRCRQILRGHTDSVNAICFQPHTNCIASVSSDRSVNFWDMRIGTLVRKFAGHRRSCNDVSFGLQGAAIVSCDAEGAVHVWDLRKMEHFLTVNCGPAAANSCVPDSSGAVIAVPSSDTTIKLLNISEGNLITSLEGHTDYVLDAHFSKDNTYLCSAGADGKVRLWQ